ASLHPGYEQPSKLESLPGGWGAQSGSISALTEIGVVCETTATPVPGKYAGANVSMQRGKRPPGWRQDQSMLDRVEMNVVGAAFEIAVIANSVFPKTLLPKRVFASRVARDGHACYDNASR